MFNESHNMIFKIDFVDKLLPLVICVVITNHIMLNYIKENEKVAIYIDNDNNVEYFIQST